MNVFNRTGDKNLKTEHMIGRLLSIATLVISLWYILACLPTYGSYLNDSVFASRFISIGGPFVYEVGMYTIPVWILYYLGYSLAALSSLRDGERGRQYLILFAAVGIIFYFFEMYWLYSVGNSDYRTNLIAGMSSVPRNVLLAILNIYFFSRIRFQSGQDH